MLEWLHRHPPMAPFLTVADRVWSYGETIAEVEARVVGETMVVRPSLTPGSVFDLLAGLSGPGVVALPPDRGIRYQASGEDWGARQSGRWLLTVFTSGTGGSPRGVRLTRSNIEAACRASRSHLGHGPDDIWLLSLPLHHVAGISILLRSAFTGGSVYLTGEFDPETVARLMGGEVTMVSMVATMLSKTLEAHPGQFEGLRGVVVGGGPIPDGLIDRAWEAHIPALPSYGMTETFGQVATRRPDAGPGRRAHPLPGVELRIEPDGRIAVAGGQVSPGYLDEPDRPGRWLVTNDLGELDAGGALLVVGRADAVIVTGGENVDPARVETVIRDHPMAGEVMVVGVPDPDWGMAVWCLYTGAASPDALAEWARGRLQAHEVPRGWLRVPVIPVVGPGKPDRAAAVRLALDRLG